MGRLTHVPNLSLILGGSYADWLSPDHRPTRWLWEGEYRWNTGVESVRTLDDKDEIPDSGELHTASEPVSFGISPADDAKNNILVRSKSSTEIRTPAILSRQ